MPPWGEALWHWFTGFGALLAVLNTAFLIFDRLLRFRPIVSVAAVRGVSGESHVTPVLRVKNAAPHDILVIERFSVTPGHLTISANSEIGAIVDALTNTDVPILLGPEMERQLIIGIGDRTRVAVDQRITIQAHWRRGVSRWFPQWPVSVRTSLRDIELRQRGAANA
jgi:hypothetical protein